MRGMVEGQAGKDCQLKKILWKNFAGNGLVLILSVLCSLSNDSTQRDKLCGRMNGHHSSMNCHHQSCDCLFDNLDNPDVECAFLDVDTISNICCNHSDDALQEFTMYKVDNAFNSIQMGQHAHSICMCTVFDVMHTIHHGIIMPWIIQERNSQWIIAKACRNGICLWQEMSSNFMILFPANWLLTWSKNLSQVECSEQSDALFWLAALQCKLKDGISLSGTLPTWRLFWGQWNVFHVSRLGWISSHLGMSTIQPVRLTRLKLQLLLLCASLWSIFRKLRAMGGRSENFMRSSTSSILLVFGAPHGYNASRPEEHHKAHAKRPGRRSQ